MQKHWSGEVWLGLEVDAEGRVTAVRVLRSSGHGVLDEAADRAVRSWRFIPARQGSRSIASRVRLPVRFRLAGR